MVMFGKVAASLLLVCGIFFVSAWLCVAFEAGMMLSSTTEGLTRIAPMLPLHAFSCCHGSQSVLM